MEFSGADISEEKFGSGSCDEISIEEDSTLILLSP